MSTEDVILSLKSVLRSLSVLGCSALLTNCGTTHVPTTGLPTPAPAGPVNSYIGQPATVQTNSPLWAITIDHSKNQYSYGAISGNPVSSTGAFSALTANFVILLGQNGYQNGLALELPGDAILLRPGDSTVPLVFAVQQSSCFAVGGNVKFLFALFPGLIGSNEAAFGRIYGDTTSDGTSWQFDNLTEYQAPDGKNLPADATFPGYAAGYSGKCSTSNGSAAISSSPLAYFNNGNTYTVPTQYVISPSGFFFENQNYGGVPPSTGWVYPQISAWGVSEYSQSLPAAALATASYVGFLREVNNSSATGRTRLVGFGNAPISGTTMTGGTFPNEDPTQPVTVNMAVTFGNQDPLNNGLFFLATLSVPYDGNLSSCPSPAPNQNGILSCAFNAVAVAGQPNGKYAIILSAFDPNGNQKTLALFQQ